MKQIQCWECGKYILKNPRNKDHRYCNATACQKARKSEWHRKKMRTDKDYILNQKRCNEKWKKANHGYWKKYREKNPAKKKRNRVTQIIRNHRRSCKTAGSKKMDASKIAKMDASSINRVNTIGEFWLIPVIAKMDASKVLISEISNSCR